MGDLLPRRRAPRILVVDDQPSIAGLMSQLLTLQGYEVITATNADQAEAEVHRHAPDLILSDVMMPGKSGYEFCRSLKDNPATRLIPFVLITGLSDSGDKVRGIEAGADDFLNKPVLAEELIARVKSLLRLKEFTDELETADSVLCTLGLIVEGEAARRLTGYYDVLQRWVQKPKSKMRTLRRALKRWSNPAGPVRWLLGGPARRMSPWAKAVRTRLAVPMRVDGALPG